MFRCALSMGIIMECILSHIGRVVFCRDCECTCTCMDSISMDMYTFLRLQYICNIRNVLISIILQVTLPAKITPRYGHSAIVFGLGDLRVVVLFGGDFINVISETTLLLMCK